MNQTKPYRRTLGGSVGAGMGSLFNPGGRKYYILEHKVSTKYHKAGDMQEIIVDNIELGRDPKCQVRFDEKFSTVSRRHAAIVRDGDGWKLVQLSKTNKTYLNGRPVQNEWYLQNGDEIQLSTNGPKLGFIVPSGKKATVGSIGLSRRLSLFRQQALRPYKTAIWSLGVLLIIGIIAGGIVIGQQAKMIQDNTAALAEAREANARNEALIAEQKRLLENQGGLLDSLKNLPPRETVRYVGGGGGNGGGSAPSGGGSDGGGNVDMSSCYPYVYYIDATVKYNGEAVSGWCGTGFLIDDGKFVTARHVTAPYYSNSYHIEEGKVIPHVDDPISIYRELLINVLAQQGEVELEFECTSPGGHFSFKGTDVQDVSKYDQIHTLAEPFQVINGDGEVLGEIPAGTQIRDGALGAGDFSFVSTGANGGLAANRSQSTELKAGTQLYILGYPNGWGESGSKPIFSTAMVSMDGLSKELGGTIMASNNNTEGGNSGGPIFIKNGDRWEVVAIVSGRTQQKGRFVPIAVIP